MELIYNNNFQKITTEKSKNKTGNPKKFRQHSPEKINTSWKPYELSTATCESSESAFP